MPTDTPYAGAALYGVLACAAILLGGRLVGPSQGARRGLQGVFASVGAGFLIGLGALGALPEALEHASTPLPPLLVALGALCLMLWLHRFGHAHQHDHGHHPDEHAHAHGDGAELSLYDARMAVGGLALHSLLDGVAVSAVLANERELGFFVAFFVLLHKLPEGAAAAALTYASGGQSGTARRGVWVVAGASLLGALAIFVVGPVLTYALAVTAGVTTGVGIGIASHLRKQGALAATLGVSSGALLFWLAEVFLHH